MRRPAARFSARANPQMRVQPGPQMTQITQTKRKKELAVTLGVIALGVGCAEAAPTDRVRVSGHVEATEVRLAPEVGGRVLTLAAKEGDRIVISYAYAKKIPILDNVSLVIDFAGTTRDRQPARAVP